MMASSSPRRRLRPNGMDELCVPVTAKTRIVIRGATTHFHASPSYARSILAYTRERGIGWLVIATPMASQALRTYFRRFRRAGKDANVEPQHCFQGDDDTLLGSLIGAADYSEAQIKQACHCVAGVMRRMRAEIEKPQGRVLVLCQVGRNRSFTTAFIYYLVYHAVRKQMSVLEALKAFRSWKGVSYDAEVQEDGYQRLCVKAGMTKPWMRGLARIFEDPQTRVITKERVDAFMSC